MTDLDNDLPVDEGHQAFRDRKTPDDNPYQEDDWRHKEWQFGWDCDEQSSDELFDWSTGKFKPENMQETFKVTGHQYEKAEVLP